MLQKLQFRPGVNREGTTLANEGGWFDGDKIRFRSGFPEKIGGWVPISSATYLGNCRSMHNWVTLKGYNLLGVGTNIKFYIEQGGAYYDVTPVRFTATLTNPFTTVNGSPIVTVTSTNHGAITGDYVTFSGATAVGGISATVLNSQYQITYVDANTYTINVGTNATSGATGGGTVTAKYQINIAANTGSVSTGWGAGLWGGITFGTATTVLTSAISSPSSTSAISVLSTTGFPTSGTIQIDSELISYTSTTSTTFAGTITRGASGTVGATHVYNSNVVSTATFYGWGQSASVSANNSIRLWSQANFGQDLLFTYRGGALYHWTPGTGASPDYSDANRATVVTGNDTPSVMNMVMESDAARITIAFGCNDLSTAADPTTLDPLLIRWSAQENYANWTPDVTNQAGTYRLSNGSQIISALQTRQEIVVWTDAAVYSMQYIGAPYVYGFTLLADNISIMSQNSVVTANGVTYWMGQDKFYVYSGRVETLPCALRSYVYDNINTAQTAQIFSGTNEGFSEVWWFYCSAGSSVVDRYVIFNYLDRVWYYGTMGRTAWNDSPLRNFPQAATYTNQIVNHENGNDDGLFNPAQPISAFVQSSDFDIGDGHNYGFVWQIIPDITFDGSTTPVPNYPSVNFTVRPRNNPGANYGTSDDPAVAATQSYAGQTTYNVQQFKQVVNARLRGRQMAFRVSSNTLGTQWQLGTPRLNVRPDGRK